MSFREKIAWAAFASTVLAWGGYFAAVIAWRADGRSHSIELFQLFVAVTVAQIVLMVVVATVSALRAPGEADVPADERDRAIGRRAGAIAYSAVLIALAVVVAWLHAGLHGSGVVFALIGVFVVGEAVRFGAQAIGYRMAAA